MMPDSISSVTEARRAGHRIVRAGLISMGVILVLTAYVLLRSLPDANAFNARVERLFVENDALKAPVELRLLEVLAQSGTAFDSVLASYRVVIVVLFVFAAALLVLSLVFLVALTTLNRRLAVIEGAGLEVSSLLISRAEGVVLLNNHEFQLSEAVMETLSTLAEARLDDEVLSGVALEALVSGRVEGDCDEAAGATRVKRLRDALGNQLVSALLVKNVARKGYMLAIDKNVIRLI